MLLSIKLHEPSNAVADSHAYLLTKATLTSVGDKLPYIRNVVVDRVVPSQSFLTRKLLVP